MSASNEWLWWILGAVGGIALCAYLVMEYLKWLERSQVYQLPTGLCFVAHGFQVETHRSGKKVILKTRHGHFAQAAMDDVAAHEKTGPLHVSISALGLRMDVSPVMQEKAEGEDLVPTGQCKIVFDNVEEKTVVTIPRVPAKVGLAFAEFARPIAVWIDKLEERRPKPAPAEATDASGEPAQEQADTAAQDEAPINTELTTDAQIALWRKRAGFSGTSTDVGLDDNGKIVWFIDLDPTGRITLHSDKRTAHSTLLGAEFISLGGELEITVRDAFWTEDEPEMQSFRVLKGRSPDERRAWKERLEILRAELQTAAKKK